MIRPTLDQGREVLRARFGYADFRPSQLPAVESVLSRRDALIVLPTGGGKSLCFQVPALLFPGLTVVVSPLISLMSDQVDALVRRGIGATFLNSTLGADETAARTAAILKGEIKLCYVAPERLASGGTTAILRSARAELLAVDEAHCVSEWGQDFRPSYLKLAAVRHELGDPQTIALTATATPRVRRDIARLLGLRNPAVIVGGFDRPNLDFHVQRVRDNAERHEVMVGRLRTLRAPAVVYASTRRQVERVARILRAGGIASTAYHAGLTAEMRDRAQRMFMGDQVPTIVATNAFGMGIDKPDVRLVLHYMHSGSLEDYYQEAGRAGRDGERSSCLLLHNRHDRLVHDRMRSMSAAGPDLAREVFVRVARASRGQRVEVDAERLAATLEGGVDHSQVSQALRLLIERDLINADGETTDVRLRLLATNLRIECERQSLGAPALRILDLAVSPEHEDGLWKVIPSAAVNLPDWQLRQGLAELESRQMVYSDPISPRLLAEDTPANRARLEHVLHMVAARRRADSIKLDAIVGYATTETCRRNFILAYFGEGRSSISCGRCDRCQATPKRRRGIN